jgi:hypothetical protein
MNKKENLLKLFTQNTEYYFHLVKSEIGHLVYVSEEKDEYSTEKFEFKLNKIIEGFLDEIELDFTKVIPSVYYTDEKNSEKLKYELTEKFKENADFSTFVESIKDGYRAKEVEDFVIFKMDPEAYEKKKTDEYQKKQQEIFERYKKQQKDQELDKRKAIAEYNNDLISLFKDNLHRTILKNKRKFELKVQFSNLIFSILSDDDEQASLWPKVDDQTIMGNSKFEPVSIEGDKLSILVCDRRSDAYIIDFKLDGDKLDIINVQDINEDDAKFMTDYEFLMKIYNFNIIPNFIDWDNMYETEKLDAVIDEIIRLDDETLAKREKQKNEIVDCSNAKAFFTIDTYEIKINNIPGIIELNVSDELFEPIENKLNELKIDFKRGESLQNRLEFIETITYKETEKIYNFLIESGYALDTYTQESIFRFMNLSKPDTSQHKIYVGWEDSNEQYYESESEEGYYDDEFSFNIYTSHNTDEVYDQAVGWIDERIENLLKHLNVGDFYISFGAAENLHSVSVKNASKGDLKTKVDNFLSEIKTIVNDTDGFEWYDDINK